MTVAEQLLYDQEEEEPEIMPLFHYEVSVPNQPVRRLIAYARNEAEALGQVTQANQRDADRPAINLDDIVLVGTFANATVLQVGGSISAT